jgi:hypothetical protein
MSLTDCDAVDPCIESLGIAEPVDPTQYIDGHVLGDVGRVLAIVQHRGGRAERDAQRPPRELLGSSRRTVTVGREQCLGVIGHPGA